MESYLPPLSEPAKRWTRFAAVLVGLAVTIWLMVSLRAVFTPLLAGLALAYILNPVVRSAERSGVRRVLAIALLYAIGAVLLTVLAVFLVGTAIDQLSNASQRLDAYWSTIERWLATRMEIPAGEAHPLEGWRELMPILQEHGAGVANSTLGFISRGITSAFTLITLFVLLPMYTFFFLWKFDPLIQSIRDHLPAAWRGPTVHIASTIDKAIANFFRGRLIVCLVVGLVTGIGWTLVGVSFGMLLGALAGVLNLVPFMSLLALPLALFIGYLDAVHADVNWVTPMLLIVGVYLLVQALESFALTPMIESRSSGLHPITTVVALLIGAEWAGLLGMLLAIPIASTLKTLSAEFLLPEIRRLARPEVPAAETSAPPPREPPAEADRTSEPLASEREEQQ